MKKGHFVTDVKDGQNTHFLVFALLEAISLTMSRACFPNTTNSIRGIEKGHFVTDVKMARTLISWSWPCLKQFH
jgi:hypothetical protein